MSSVIEKVATPHCPWFSPLVRVFDPSISPLDRRPDLKGFLFHPFWDIPHSLCSVGQLTTADMAFMLC
jgi:hypothetical protein